MGPTCFRGRRRDQWYGTTGGRGGANFQVFQAGNRQIWAYFWAPMALPWLRPGAHKVCAPGQGHGSTGEAQNVPQITLLCFEKNVKFVHVCPFSSVLSVFVRFGFWFCLFGSLFVRFVFFGLYLYFLVEWSLTCGPLCASYMATCRCHVLDSLQRGAG